MNNKTVTFIVLDGMGIREDDFGNAFNNAYKPNIDKLITLHPNWELKAHGTAVGLPSDDDMGNSEVGHNAIGCGQIYAQGAKLVNQSIEDGSIFMSDTWKELKDNCLLNNSTMHFIGLLSDGNVHSNISHLEQLIKRCKLEGIKKVRIHALLDGRDVGATSAHIYINRIEKHMESLNDESFDARIASGGGRMAITMDRYQADWNMVKIGWDTHVLGKGRLFESAMDALETYRNETGAIDQDIPPFVIGKSKPNGTVEDKDSVVFFNFRGDRALEMTMAFENSHFDKFDRERLPDVIYAGMLQYDGDLKIPKKFLVYPPKINNTLTEYLVEKNIKEFAISETQKFGHVTYFWNGNRNEKFNEKLESYFEIKSDIVPFEQRPWMKAAQITDKVIEVMKSGEYQFIRANFPNGDMVGHTGDYQAAKIAVECVDLELGRIIKTNEEIDGILVVTADHGNCEEMYDPDSDKNNPKVKTSHTLNPVPFIICDNTYTHSIKNKEFGLSNIAATLVELMGFDKHDKWDESMLEKQDNAD